MTEHSKDRPPPRCFPPQALKTGCPPPLRGWPISRRKRSGLRPLRRDDYEIRLRDRINTEFASLQGRGSLNANLWDGQSAGKPSIKLRTVSSGACRPSRIISVMSGARKALRSVRLT
jgi:hypothetical protein